MPYIKAEWRWPIVCAAAAATFLFVSRPLPQDEAFHRFADARTILGVPGFWNVVSNLPFAVIGILGLFEFRGLTDRVLFSGVLLTAFGSAWYHLAPDDTRLVWDRLPMTLVFTSFVVAAFAADRRKETSRWILALLVAVGAVSVCWWAATNDLRPYAVVKFGAILFVLPSMFRSKHGGYLWATLGLFALAEALEMTDHAMGLGFLLSGHTLKHLFAGAATWAILRWRRDLRGPVTGTPLARRDLCQLQDFRTGCEASRGRLLPH